MLWPFRPCGNKFVWFVPPFLFRVLLFHTERPINAGRSALSPGSRAVLRARPIRPARPLGCLKHSGFGLGRCWPMERFSDTQRHSIEGEPAERDGKILRKPERLVRLSGEATNEWMDSLSSISHSSSQTFCAWKVFLFFFYKAQQPWRMSLNHGTSMRRPPLTDVYCMGGLGAGRAFEDASGAERRRHL